MSSGGKGAGKGRGKGRGKGKGAAATSGASGASGAGAGAGAGGAGGAGGGGMVDARASPLLIGQACVNAGHFNKAIEVFDALIAGAGAKNVDAYLGRGSAYAMTQRFSLAIRDFSKAIELDPKHADAHKRRGQVYGAVGKLADALSDLDAATLLEPDAGDTYFQRAMLYFKAEHFTAALSDFVKATMMDPTSAQYWNMRAQCENSLGLCKEATQSFDRAIKIDPKYKEAHVNLGQTRRAFGDMKGAEAAFNKALEIDPVYTNALHMRAMLYHGVGRTVDALNDVHAVLRLDPADENCLFMAAVCLHSIGSFKEAVKRYDELFLKKPSHLGFCQREWALMQASNLSKDVRSMNFDAVVPPALKEGFAKRVGRNQLPSSYIIRTPSVSSPDVILRARLRNPDAQKLLECADKFGGLLQYKSPGFLSNRRQHRQFGLAVIEIAQLCTKHWEAPLGVMILNSSASSPAYWKADSGSRHLLNSRDVYDVAVRWRQLSEPFDPVFYIDGLTRKAFEEGFGLQTPMVSGQMKVVRYYTQFPRAFRILKKLCREQCTLTDKQREAVAKAKTCDDMYEIMQRDFWVVTPCHSIACQGRVMEGTRLTIQARNPPQGFDFTIRTPGTPARWAHFMEELQLVFQGLTLEMRKPPATRNLARCAHLALASYFYWTNMGPLTRGSAAVGMAVLVGMSIACGLEEYLTLPLPSGQQLDWDAILTPEPWEFVRKSMPTVFGKFDEDEPFGAEPVAISSAQVVDVATALPTLQHVLQALNARWTGKR